jgi:hypothetical protein
MFFFFSDTPLGQKMAKKRGESSPEVPFASQNTDFEPEFASFKKTF